MSLNKSMILKDRHSFAAFGKAMFIMAFSFLCITKASAQLDCPPNVDFEDGNYGYWSFYTGTCCAINTPVNSGQVNNRHMLTTGAANDMYGGFPTVAPGGGAYSLKLGNNGTGAQAERARYYIHVPATVNNYSLVYRYAVVFQNPNHTAPQQPRFEVKAYDSATNMLLACSDRSYVASSSIPGFQLSTVGTGVYYLPWTTATLNLSGLAGQTVIVDFASGDCSQGGHFGYGYVDLQCGLFQISTLGCNIGGNTTLTAPSGYQGYTWMDENLTTVIGTTQTISILTPSVTTTYKVILTPYAGYGCPDTLKTQILISNLNINPNNDTILCNSAALQFNANLTGGLGTINYTWTPAATLSCSNCPNPIATPFSTTTYHLTVSDSSGCTKHDSIKVFYEGVNFTINPTMVNCFGGNDGAIAINILSGPPPFTFTWNTSPVEYTASIDTLTAGSYTLIINDSIGCEKTTTVVITEPTQLSFTSTITNVLCHGGNDGAIDISAIGGVSPYTYSNNGGTSYNVSNVFSTLTAGSYPLSVKDSHNCVTTDTADVTEPPAFTFVVDSTNILCNGYSTGTIDITASGGVTPYQYSINAQPYVSSGSFTNLPAGSHNISAKDDHGCITTRTVVLTEPPAVVPTVNITHELCYGDSLGIIKTISVVGGISPYLYAIDAGAYSAIDSFKDLPWGNYTLHIKDSNLCVKDTVVTITQPPLLVPNVTLTQPLCYLDANGVIVYGIVGGTPGYTYAINGGTFGPTPTFTGLLAGMYTITVKDNNACLHDTTFTLNQPTVLQFTTALEHNKCFGDTSGKVIVTASGATPGYQYSYDARPWQTSTTLTGFTAGSHTVRVMDANGCQKDATVILTEPEQLYVHTWIKNPTCEGYKDGVVSLTGQGGVTPYLYSKDGVSYTPVNGYTDFPEGTFTFYIQDSNFCRHDTSITLVGYPYIRYTVDVEDVSCYGLADANIKFNMSGGVPPFIFQLKEGIFSWRNSNVFDSLKKGIYSFQIKDSKNCAKDTTVIVTQPTKLGVRVVVTPNDCQGQDKEGGVRAEVSGGTPPYQYLWSTNPQATTQKITGMPNGRYIVHIKDDHDCADSVKAIVAYDNCCTPNIPDAFTPNGDARNDVFRVQFKGDMTLQGFSIFNRYGQRLFFTENINDSWDGTFAGRPQDMGTYFYYIKVVCGNKGDNVLEFKGDLTLIR